MIKKIISTFLLTLLLGVFPCQISHAEISGDKEINHHHGHENNTSEGIHCENSFPIEEIKNFQSKSENIQVNTLTNINPVLQKNILALLEVKDFFYKENKFLWDHPPQKTKIELLAWLNIRLII